MKATLMIALTVLVLQAPGRETKIINSYIGALKIAKPIVYKNLMIYPLTKAQGASLGYVTLDEAYARDWLTIREIGDGEVNHVELKNSGPRTVFIMTGEMLSGAKQDRMLREDVLVPPKSDWLRVPVYCVEHGRWVSTSPTFKSSKELVPNDLRQRARITENQSEVWDAIASSQERLGIASSTSTVHANYDDEEFKKEIQTYERHFGRLPELSRNTVGVVVVTGNRVICIDIFASNELINRYWNKLLRSYVMDALSEEKPVIGREDIQDLIQALSNTKQVSVGTPGLGNLYRIENDSGKGTALIHNGKVVHLDFFVDDSRDDGGQWRLDMRREQRLED
ncbi:MAG: hypothetical protein JSU64_03525 [candidate division WOR-3 bacterium]|nr:MAG: hypothetical protein JSU64_03525 [candidate division WOR-3 bacterium]